MGVGAASRNKAVVMMSVDGDTALGNPRVSIECICRNCQARGRKMRTEASLG